MPLPHDVSSVTSEPDVSVQSAEQAALVAEEVERLPARYREPVILCFFRGLTQVQASVQLGWSIGTVASRIARAKERLRDRLTKRGVILGTSLSAAMGVPSLSSACPSLIRACVHSAFDHNIVPSHISTLSNEVISTMHRTQRKWLLAIPVVTVSLTLGVVLGGSEAKEIPKPPEPQRVELVDPFKGLSDVVQVDLTGRAGAKERAYSQRKLNRIAQAMWAYQTLHGYLPTDILDKDGKALLSWRVAILPHIEQVNVYKLFKLDEPWDSANNKPLSEIILKLYVSGDLDPTHIGYTSVKRFTGPNTLHRPGEKVVLPKIPNNLLRTTILLAEVGTPVPWSKPDDPTVEPLAKDKPFTPKNPPDWKGIYSNVINVAFADTTAHSLRPDLTSETVANLCYWKDDKNLADRERLQAIIPPKEENDDLKELQQRLRQMTDDFVKLCEEETNLVKENARLGNLPADAATQLAKELLELDAQLSQLRNNVRNLKKQMEEKKKLGN